MGVTIIDVTPIDEVIVEGAANFAPAGPQGPQGLTGAQGPQGEVGDGPSIVAGGNVPMTFVSTNYLPLTPMGATQVTSGRSVNPDVNNIDMLPVTLGRSVTVDRLSAAISGAAAGGTAIFGIYDCGSNGKPNNLIWSSGPVDASVVSTKDFIVDVTLPAGVLWIVGGTSAAAITYYGWTMQAPSGIGGGGGTGSFWMPRGFAARTTVTNWGANDLPANLNGNGIVRGHDSPDSAPSMFMRVVSVNS